MVSSYGYAQTAQEADGLGSIKGYVIDSATRTRLSHVTVTVREIDKEQLFKSTLSNERGFFEVTRLPYKVYQLFFTCSGYKTTSLQFSTFSSSPTNLGQIALVSLAKQLDEVAVASHKPLLEQALDKLIYNVDADPESKTANALDLLRKIPLLTIDADDNLQLNGSSSFRVLVNGKISTLFLRHPSEVFQNMPASAIRTIEVITNPPSKFTAEGVGGVINITTHKKIIGGYTGGWTIRGSSPRGLSSTGHITHKKGKLGLSANLGYNYSCSPVNGSSLDRRDKLKGDRLEQAAWSSSGNRAQNASGEVSYEPNSQNMVAASYSANSSNGTSDVTQLVTLFNFRGEPMEAHRRLNAGRNRQQGREVGLDYQHLFNENEERQLTLSYRWSRFTASNHTDFLQQPLVSYKGQSSTTSNNNHSGEHTLHADYIHPFKKNVLELGFHSTFRQDNSDFFYKNLDTATNVYVLDSAQSNNFHYKETIHAAYATLSLNLNKWGFKAGVRLESARAGAQFKTSDRFAVQHYANLIPHITLSRQGKGISQLKLSYTQRLQRPDLSYLDPYADLSDPWNISYGNPDLKPALAHAFELAYHTSVKKVSLNATFFHQFTNNAIQQFTVLGTDTIARTTFGNIGKSRNFSLSVNGVTTLFEKLSLNVSSRVYYLAFNSYINGLPQQNEGLSWSVSGSVQLRQKGWRAGTNLSYSAPNVLVQGRSAGSVSNSVSVSRYLLKHNKGQIGLSITSPFRKRRQSFTEINDPAFYQRRESYTLIRRYSLSFHYRFGKVQ